MTLDLGDANHGLFLIETVPLSGLTEAQVLCLSTERTAKGKEASEE